MLRLYTEQIAIQTRGRGLYEITDQVQAAVRRSGFQQGIVHLLLRHTSASLLIQENADPQVRQDLEQFFSHLCPDGNPMFRHRYEGPDDMPAHVRTALTQVTLSIPFLEGRLALGTWQGIYVWEHRQHGERRSLVVSILGE